MPHRPLNAAPLTLALVCGSAAFVSAQTSELGRCLLRITGFRAVQEGLAQGTIDLAVPVDGDRAKVAARVLAALHESSTPPAGVSLPANFVWGQFDNRSRRDSVV